MRLRFFLGRDIIPERAEVVLKHPLMATQQALLSGEFAVVLVITWEIELDDEGEED